MLEAGAMRLSLICIDDYTYYKQYFTNSKKTKTQKTKKQNSNKTKKMKKNLFFAALAVVAMASCSKNEAVDPVAATSVAKSIELDTFIDRSTKASDATTATLQGAGFKVIGYRHDDADLSISSNSKVVTIMPDWSVSYVDGGWSYLTDNDGTTQTDAALQWDDTGDQLSFFAYSGSASLTSGTDYTEVNSTTATTAEDKIIPSFTFTTAAKIEDQEDLITATSLNNVYSDSPSPITLDFYHVLSKIGFKAEEGDTSTDAVILTGLTVEFVDEAGNALKSKGTYQFSDGNAVAEGWSILSDATALVSGSGESIMLGGSTNEIILSETAQNVTADNGYIMIIPQELKADNIVKVEAKYKIGQDGSDKTKSVYLPAMTFEAGKWYTFNLILADNSIRFSSAISVTSWDGSNYEM